ncbi:MAG: AAA family ATPase [archaeon]
MIKSIYLENFKVHSKSYLEFNTGANILIGKIGSGKSSIVDGICYALFGSFPSSANKSVSLAEVISFKPFKKTSSLIKLEFCLDNKNYRIEREIFLDKTNQAKLYLEDKLIAGPKQTDVNLKVSQIIGIDYNLFIKIIYCSQNELDYFLKIAPFERKKLFDDLFGISQLELIKENTKKLKSKIDNDIELFDSKQKSLDSLVQSYNLANLEAKQKDTISKISGLENEITNNKSLELELNKKQLILKDKKERCDKLKQDLNYIKSKINDYKKEIEKSESNKFTNLSIIELNNLKQKLQEEIFYAKKELLAKAKLSSEKDIFLRNLAQIDTELNQINLITNENQLPSEELVQKDIDEIDNLVDSLRSNKSSLNSKISELSLAIIELNKGQSTCPVCDSKLDAQKSAQKAFEKQAQLKTCKDELLNLDKQINLAINNKKDLSDLQKKISNNKLALQKSNDLKARKSITLNDLKIAEEKLSAINTTDEILKSKEIEMENLISVIKILDTKEQLRNLELKEKQLIVSFEEMSFNEEEYLLVFSQFKNINSKIESATREILSYKKILDEIILNLERYKSLTAEKEIIASSKNHYFLKSNDLSYYLKASETSQVSLRKIIVDNLNSALDMIWGKIYPYKDYTSLRLQPSSDYVLEVRAINNEWIRVDGILSGGEKTTAALAIRIALALILTKKLGLLILDEPTHNLDLESIYSISRLIDNELPSLIEQIFIVTHDKELLESVNSTRFLIDRDKENDSYSEIKRL